VENAVDRGFNLQWCIESDLEDQKKIAHDTLPTVMGTGNDLKSSQLTFQAQYWQADATLPETNNTCWVLQTHGYPLLSIAPTANNVTGSTGILSLRAEPYSMPGILFWPVWSIGVILIFSGTFGMFGYLMMKQK